MNIVHLHLLLNHVPVIGAVFAVLLLGVALVRRSSEMGKLALAFLALLGAISVAVFFTGEPAEELVEKLPDFSEALTERHEEMALAATITMGAFGTLAALALGFFRRRALPRLVTGAAFVAALVAAGLMGVTANLGGQIRHTEIRPAAGARGAVDTTKDERGPRPVVGAARPFAGNRGLADDAPTMSSFCRIASVSPLASHCGVDEKPDEEARGRKCGRGPPTWEWPRRREVARPPMPHSTSSFPFMPSAACGSHWK